MRGLQGSGKSTTAEILKKCYGGEIASTDYFWQTKTKSYDFWPKFLQEAHMWCQGTVAKMMVNDVDTIIIDNTNILLEHMEPYIKLAQKGGYEVKMIMPKTEWAKNPEQCFKRCQHNVPLSVIQACAAKFQHVKQVSEYIYEVESTGL